MCAKFISPCCPRLQHSATLKTIYVIFTTWLYILKQRNKRTSVSNTKTNCPRRPNAIDLRFNHLTKRGPICTYTAVLKRQIQWFAPGKTYKGSSTDSLSTVFLVITVIPVYRIYGRHFNLSRLNPPFIIILRFVQQVVLCIIIDINSRKSLRACK